MLPCLFNTFLKQFIKRSKDESDELNTDLSEQEKEEIVIKQVHKSSKLLDEFKFNW